MLDKRGFNLGLVFTAVSLGFIVGLIGCGVAGFVCGLNLRALVASNIVDNADNVLGGGFVGASEFFLLGGGYLHVFDV